MRNLTCLKKLNGKICILASICISVINVKIFKNGNIKYAQTSKFKNANIYFLSQQFKYMDNYYMIWLIYTEKQLQQHLKQHSKINSTNDMT